jgi:hypothetical protein
LKIFPNIVLNREQSTKEKLDLEPAVKRKIAKENTHK